MSISKEWSPLEIQLQYLSVKLEIRNRKESEGQWRFATQVLPFPLTNPKSVEVLTLWSHDKLWSHISIRDLIAGSRQLQIKISPVLLARRFIFAVIHSTYSSLCLLIINFGLISDLIFQLQMQSFLMIHSWNVFQFKVGESSISTEFSEMKWPLDGREHILKGFEVFVWNLAAVIKLSVAGWLGAIYMPT